MSLDRKLPPREAVFVESLLYHGFRVFYEETYLKNRCGYITPANQFEDSSGIDFWVKMPKDVNFFPIQVTQRGNRLRQKHENVSETRLKELCEELEQKLHWKRIRCKKHGIAFVLVRDWDGNGTNPTLAMGDVLSLRYAIDNLRRWI